MHSQELFNTSKSERACLNYGAFYAYAASSLPAKAENNPINFKIHKLHDPYMCEIVRR